MYVAVDFNLEWEYYNPYTYEEPDDMDFTRLIDNACKARENATSEWAKNYWMIVVHALLRRVGVH